VYGNSVTEPFLFAQKIKSFRQPRIHFSAVFEKTEKRD